VATHGVSIIVPAYNEERRLPRLLAVLEREAESVVAAAGLRLEEVLIVDDGSTDRTPEVLRASRAAFGVVRLEEHRGKGAAVGAGVLAATADRLLVVDVDLSTPLDGAASLSRALDAGADVAIGSRSLPASQVLVHQPRYRELMGKTFNVLFRGLTGLRYRDTQCGFKLFRREVARQLFALRRVDGFAFDAELCVNAERLGFRVVEVPVRWTNDPQTHVTLFASSFRMAIDLLAIAWRGRRRRASGSAPETAAPSAARRANS
jgi:dolichyl-phosphate beta-glucosyltransferase